MNQAADAITGVALLLLSVRVLVSGSSKLNEAMKVWRRFGLGLRLTATTITFLAAPFMALKAVPGTGPLARTLIVAGAWVLWFVLVMHYRDEMNRSFSNLAEAKDPAHEEERR